ncbi:MAG: tetraacyldisaccharide 4'-kinase [Thermodesulfobacteriota bacterium]
MGGIIRKTVESYIRGEASGGAGTLLEPLSYLYEAGVRTRLGLYRAGVLRPRSLPCKVISVGNITAGGSGKTPVAMHIARYLKKRGARVVIVSRGYGGSLKGPAIVSNGSDDGVILGPGEAGDEPVLMARRLKGVPVVVGAKRYEAGTLAVKEFAPTVIILDDGFQHIRLSRDLNILLVDGALPLAGSRLLPAGPLREPVSACRRADLVLVKGGSLNDRDKDLLRGYDIQSTGFVYRAGKVMNLATGETLTVAALKGKSLLAVAGIARPSSFFGTLQGQGLKVVGTISYTDHHPYGTDDIRAIREKMKTCGAAALITTEKDGVKLAALVKGSDVTCYALSIDVVLKEKSVFRRAMAPFTEGAGKGEGS